MSHILIFAHSENPPLAALLPMLKRLGHSYTITRMLFGEKPPAHKDVDGVIILGAAANIRQADELEWLQREMAWVKDFITTKRPIFGICFGCQMLAKLMGGDTFVGDNGREFSYTNVTLENSDPIFKPEILAKLPVFQAHRETYTLPTNATRLLSGDTYTEQAAKFGHNLYGVQFHPEICAEIATRWHRFGLERDFDFGENFPSIEEHTKLASKNQKPVHAWLEGFLSRLF